MGPTYLSIFFALLSPYVLCNNGLSYTTTPNGYTAPPRGWNAWGLADNKFIQMTQDDILTQCTALNTTNLVYFGYNVCSIDSGWSLGSSGDDYGRVVNDPSVFPDMTALGDQLHEMNLLLGIYILPGVFAGDGDKTIYGTDITIRSIWDTTQYTEGRWMLNWNDPGAQTYCDTNVALWASWGVDYIKLDFMTPGSNNVDGQYAADSSGAAVCYHNAIQSVGRPMRLDLSYALDWTSPDPYDIWASNADGMRVDQDVNNGGSDTLVAWGTIQRTIEKYREYILYQSITVGATTLSIYPDLDALFAGNGEGLTGITDTQRMTTMFHWVGAGANLLLGSDLTDLDSFGASLIGDSVLNSIADLTAQYPMTPTLGNDDLSLGSQFQLWIAGPDQSGQIAVLMVNFGTSGDNSLFSSTTDTEDTILFSINGAIPDAYQADTWDYDCAFSSCTSGSVGGSDVISSTIADSESIMFLASPASSGSKRKLKRDLKAPVEEEAVLQPAEAADSTSQITSALNLPSKVVRNAPTTVVTQATYPISSPGCQFDNLNGTIPVGFQLANETISSADLLFIIRSALCTTNCSIPGLIPSDTASAQVSSDQEKCEISIEMSDKIEAWGYRGTSAVGVEYQECWDATAYIIENCIDKNYTTGWWNGDHAYQYYQMGFRPLNLPGYYHVMAGDNLTVALTSVSTLTSTFSTNPFLNSTTATTSEPGPSTLPTAASSITGAGSGTSTGTTATTSSTSGASIGAVVWTTGSLLALMYSFLW